MENTIKRIVTSCVVLMMFVGGLAVATMADDTEKSPYMILPLNETEIATWNSFGFDNIGIQGQYSIAMFAGSELAKIIEDSSEESKKKTQKAIKDILFIEEKLGLRVMVAQSLYWLGKKDMTPENIAGINAVMTLLETKYGKKVVQGHENYMIHLSKRAVGLK
jgi:hypothetical protein